LFAIVAGSALTAVIIRPVMGLAAIQRYRQELDGLNILVAFVFVGAVMEHVAASLLGTPLPMLALAGVAFAVSYALLGLTMLVFTRAGRGRAFVLGMMAAQRNTGLMLAATGGAVPELVWLYFAMCQFPIYLSPQLLKPWACRLSAGLNEAREKAGPAAVG
jgi:hypothetical protein